MGRKYVEGIANILEGKEEDNKVETMANKKVKGPKNKRTNKTDKLWIGKNKNFGFKKMQY